MKTGTKIMAAVVACLLAGLAAAPGAGASFGITEFGGAASIEGEFSRQAGAHADLTTSIRFPTTTIGGQPALDGRVRTVEVDLPPGLIGDPTAPTTCTNTELVAGLGGKWPRCPVASQVGIAAIYVSDDLEDAGIQVPVYNLRRPGDLPALFAFNYAGAVVRISPSLRPGDYGVATRVPSISESIQVAGTKLVLWGVPADPAHDAERFSAGTEEFEPIQGAQTEAPLRPFLTMPTFCDEAASVVTGAADSWQNPGVFSHAAFDRDLDGVPFVWDGCDRLPFAPGFAARPRSHSAALPTGLNIDVSLPQSEDPYGLATAAVRRVAVTLPRGMELSASAAAGLGSCAPGQIGLGSNAAPTCPDSSSVGSVKIKTPLLDEELEGGVFLAKQNDNPFGSLLALYLAVKGPGFYLKLPGKVDLDPATGQVTATFSETPQLPFEELHMSLLGGAQAPLRAPQRCGTYSTHVELTSWASPVPVSLESPMTIDEGCATGGFSPKLRAGTASPIGGSFSPFNLQVTRADGEQNIARIDATLPEGVLARLAGVPLCGDAAAATGACPASSQVGTTTVGAGAGSNPIYVPEAGKAPTAVYLAGPYKGAPYSLVVKVPAQAGPFDLGTVVVRNAIDVDPVTTRVSVKSDPLPQILQGIPIAYRDVRVEINRPDFTLNPTGCERTKVEATIVSAEGKSASPAVPFQAAACGELGFQPKLTLSLSGKTNRSAHPKLRAVLTARKGDANIGRAQVTLPKTEFLENAHIQTICTRVQFAADNCPAKSVYGYAKAWSPLLDKPIQGPVYLRSSNHELPDLVASLDGQIHVDLQGRIDSVRARIRNTFDFVPDAPVSKFVLTMQGGKKGLLVNNTELCKTTPRATVEFDGQNGKTADSNPLVGTDCGKSRKR